MVPLGQLTKKAIFEEQTPVDQIMGTGGDWVEVWKAFVSLEPLSGKEMLLAQQVQSQQTHRMRTIWPLSVEITEKMRVKIAKQNKVDDDPASDKNFRIFNIDDTTNVGELNRELELTVIELP